MKRTVHFVASAIVVNQSEQVLLVKHKKLGVWLYPGGHIEPHETPDEALVREVREETGLRVEIVSSRDRTLADKKADVSSLHIPYAVLCERIRGVKGCDHHLDLVYRCRILGPRTRLQRHAVETEDIGFFGVEALDQLKMFPNLKALLRKFLLTAHP
ncbi:MAG: NUDIX domain-containing protein [Candidatus Komeilibacteria bacterium]|nr:NUDIX domain-containing protein [Candidatus Komeilibacteria bacterium]